MTESILSAGELDALRDAVDGDDVPETGGRRRTTGVGGVHFDGDGFPRFRFGEGPVGGTQREERLSYVFDRAARMLERRLADVFQKSVSATVTFLKVGRFAEFRDVFEVDVRELAMLGYKIAGMPGQGLLVVEPEIVEKIVEGLMGGGSPGSADDMPAPRGETRSVTPLDVRVCKRVMAGFLDDVGITWNPSDPLRMTVTAADSTGVVARVFSESTPVVSGLIELSLEDDLLGMIGLVLPRGVLDLLADPGNQESSKAVLGVPRGPFTQEITGFNLMFEVALTQKRITVRELLALSEGDVLHFSQRGKAVCTVQGVPKFTGVPGKKNGNKAIQIVDVLGRNDHAS
jgi:flagellar motor switch protein FliM